MYLLIENHLYRTGSSVGSKKETLPLRVFFDMGDAMKYVKEAIRENVVGTTGDYEEGTFGLWDSADDVGKPYPYYTFRLLPKDLDDPIIDYTIIDMVDGSVIEL